MSSRCICIPPKCEFCRQCERVFQTSLGSHVVCAHCLEKVKEFCVAEKDVTNDRPPCERCQVNPAWMECRNSDTKLCYECAKWWVQAENATTKEDFLEQRSERLYRTPATEMLEVLHRLARSKA